MQISSFIFVYGLIFTCGNQLLPDSINATDSSRNELLKYNNRVQLGIDLFGAGKIVSNNLAVYPDRIRLPVKVFFKHPVSKLISLRYEFQYKGFDYLDEKTFSQFNILDSIPPYQRVTKLPYSKNVLYKQRDSEYHILVQSNFIGELPFIGFGLGLSVGKVHEVYSGYHETWYENTTPSYQFVAKEFYYTFSDVKSFKAGYLFNVNFTFWITKKLSLVSDLNFIINTVHSKQKNFYSCSTNSQFLEYKYDESNAWLHFLLAYAL